MIITKTPLRVSLLGGNTDFPVYFNKHNGACLSMTINKYIYCIVKKRFDNQIWVNYSKKEIVDKIDDIKHDLVREAMRLVGVDKGIEITFLSDIPSEGSGLGSSSAVTIGLLNALHAYKGESVPSRQLAEEACWIERDILEHPIGIQDQYAIAFGGFNLLRFKKDEVEVTPISFKNNGLMLFYTGITRKADKILSNMKLDKRILDQNKKLVYQALEDKNFGKHLNEYWELKKKLNKSVTNSKIDRMYKDALMAGAVGGKIVGAGGGGFLLLVVPLQYQEPVRLMLSEYEELPFNLDNFGSRVIFNT